MPSMSNAHALNGFAHGITRVSLAKVSGQHLSLAPNHPVEEPDPRFIFIAGSVREPLTASCMAEALEKALLLDQLARSQGLVPVLRYLECTDPEASDSARREEHDLSYEDDEYVRVPHWHCARCQRNALTEGEFDASGVVA